MPQPSADSSAGRTTAMTRKVLVAVDGSPYSANSIGYLARLFDGVGAMEFHLFNVFVASIPETQVAWIDENDLRHDLDPIDLKKYQTIAHCLKKAGHLLARHGIGPHQVKQVIRLARRGMAPDLLHEARAGLYDALLIGRRGLSMVQEMILGSVSKTVLQKCHDVPIWLIDGQVDSRKFLVPIDGTVHSLRAVDHLAFILRGNPHAEVTLFHSPQMFAGKPEMNTPEFAAIWGEEWCAAHLTGPDRLFHAPEQLLRENDFPPARLHRLETRLGLYPSSQIVRQALVDDFGTIVMGRRPGDAKKGLFGGVTDKVLALAEQVAIWIVG
ncbi:MAG: universal stress protein [Deltaproteobacteria bacterium CG23_combo_of_CG06-09_8_20_14_all_60_8]|nr:MAG: universal stress protein [Deltaproteobacteria bacterium CG23_combo_of_CG06-09_8_20_14_all_60_8]